MRRDIPRSRPTCSMLTKYRQVYGCTYTTGYIVQYYEKKVSIGSSLRSSWYVCLYDLDVFLLLFLIFHLHPEFTFRIKLDVYYSRILLNFTHAMDYTIYTQSRKERKSEIKNRVEEYRNQSPWLWETNVMLTRKSTVARYLGHYGSARAERRVLASQIWIGEHKYFQLIAISIRSTAKLLLHQVLVNMVGKASVPAKEGTGKSWEMAIYRRLPSYGIACYSYEPRHVPGFFIWYAFYDFSRATSLAFSSARREWSDRGYLHANRSLLPCARKLCTRNGRRPCRGCEIDRPISSPPIRGTDPLPLRHFLHLRRPSIVHDTRTPISFQATTVDVWLITKPRADTFPPSRSGKGERNRRCRQT